MPGELDIFREPPGDLIEERKKRLVPLSRRITRDEMLNVFTPKQAVRNPAKFVGRQQPLEQIIDALLTKGADILVFGERGCGKSSMAHMLQDVAAGHTELLDYYGLREQLQRRGLLANLISNKQRPYNVIWVDGFNKPLDDVIRAILTRRADNLYGPGMLAYFPREADQEEI